MKWPRSLAGQMALLIALALFVAQAINFSLVLRDRRAFRLAQATEPAAARIAEALDREARGERPITADRGRVRRSATGAYGPERHPEVITELRRELRALGVAHGAIRTEHFNDADRPFRKATSRLLISVEQPGRGWLRTYVPWPRPGARLALGLLSQTLILYAAVLLPVLWIVRRLSRPLHDLTRAAEGFDPAAPPAPMPVRGPEDVAALVGAFNRLQGRVRAMLDEKDRMLGAIGHDLRTPLAALRVRVESVEDEGDRARMADTIVDMDRTLDDILSLARVGRSAEPMSEVDLSALVDAVVEDFRDLGAEVAFADPGRITLRLRGSPMRRAVRNLVENAVKYGGGATVRIEQAPRRVAVVVEDHGPGIPAERLDHVFDPFTRLETSRNRDTGGIGLGLALARAIVREMGGEIALANREGGGLAATITLPRSPSSPRT